jgi:uncharacterized protein YcbK (DUF882 family)
VPKANAGRFFVNSRLLRPLATAGIAVVFSLAFVNGLENAIANGDTRTLSFHHVHTNENLTVTFKRDGRYDQKALEQLNWLLRDWRTDEPTRMDPQLFDLLWDVYRDVGGKEPVSIVSAYRSPNTNAMLRKRGRGVARHSQHMIGRAIDFFIPGVDLAALRVAGLRMQRGGIGFYPTSGSPFVHMDTAGVRHWPRMTRDELARVFPTGKTVHIPADGKPMPGFDLAYAELVARGAQPGHVALATRGGPPASVVATQPAALAHDGGRLKRFIASLFGGAEDDEEELAASAKKPLPVATSLTAGPPPPGSTPRPAATAPRPTAVAALQPTLPEQRKGWIWQPSLPASPAATTVAVAHVPLPIPRPAEAGEMTATLPEAIVGRPPAQPRGTAFSYAPEHELGVAQPPVPTPAVLAAAVRAPRPTAHAPAAPAVDLMDPTMVQLVGEMHHPDLDTAHRLIDVARAALPIGFGRDLVPAPAPSHFGGATFAPLPVVAFTGQRLARRN